MRIVILLILIMMSTQSFSQFKSGFDKYEARDMLAICNSFTFIELYNSDTEILPPKYIKRYTSGTFGTDNKFQIYVNGKVGVINLRGSTSKKTSWLANINSSMIPSTGMMKLSDEDIYYKFAADTNASVHAGYALAVAYLSKEIIFHINTLNREGISDIIITGHSQGGAIANLLRAYLENLPEAVISINNKFKTYSFAAPMTGNEEFSKEYNLRFCENKTSFNIINQGDPVPRFPLSYDDKDFITNNVKNLLFNSKEFSFKKTMIDGAVLLLEDNISRSIKRVSSSATGQVSKDIGQILMPDYVSDINYSKIGNIVEIYPVEYPKILKDSTILDNDSIIDVYGKCENGHILNEKLYKDEPWTFQHKPYNYYLSFMIMFFPDQYMKLERKCFLD